MNPEENMKDGKYEEALERARKGMAIDEIFPELHESEDERIRETLIHIVKGACDKYGIKYKGDDITEEKLLSYLERQKEQQPAEWSEEDEHYFQNLIMAVDSTFSDGNTKNWLQNRLKSIRPYPHWKPSEEQMWAFEIAKKYTSIHTSDERKMDAGTIL